MARGPSRHPRVDLDSYQTAICVRVLVLSAFLLFAASAASAAVFALAAWLLRASVKRTLAALAGGVVGAAVNIAFDAVAYRQDWWRYTFTSDDVAPLTYYLPVALLFGAAAGLVGWRIIRAFEWTGVVIFFGFFVGIGVIRDHVLAERSALFQFGPGLTPHVADAVGYFALALAVQLTMRGLIGKAQRDELRAA